VTFVLASQSPRRRRLLAQAGFSPFLWASDVDETPLLGEDPRIYVQRLARAKAAAFDAQDPRVVLASDTTVALGQRIIGKPNDRSDARAMLQELSGVTHVVHTAVALRLPGGGGWLEACVTTEVSFRALSTVELDRYLATDEWTDKAGAYAVQGEAAGFVDRIVGSYTSVIGLPVRETMGLLAQAGVVP
jgi:septum formation protein